MDQLAKIFPKKCEKCGLQLTPHRSGVNPLCRWCEQIGANEFPAGPMTDAEIHRKLTHDSHQVFLRLQNAIHWWPKTKISQTAILKLIEAEEAFHRAADEYFEKTVQESPAVLVL